MAGRSKRGVNIWLDRIDASNKIYEKWHKDYRTWVRFFRGKQWSEDEAMGSINPIVINYVYNTIKTMVPTLFFKNPKIFVVPTRPEFQQNALLVQHLANYDWRTKDIKKEFKMSILRSLIGGLCWIETGYAFEVEPKEEDNDELTEEEIDRIVQNEGSPEPGQQQEFTEFRIKRDEPFAISRSILDVRVDPTSDVFEEQGWHAVREIKPIERVKKDPRFKGVRNLDANHTYDRDIVLNTFREEYQKEDDNKFVELWHVTDNWEGKTFTVARGHNRKLREFDTPLGYGLEPLSFNDDPEQPQPISVVELIRDMNMEKNRLRAYMLEHIKRTLPRMIIDRNQVMDEEDREKLASAEHMELVDIPGGAGSVQPLNFPSIPADLFGVDTRINEDIQIGSGLSDFQRGLAAKVPSATEAQIIEQASRLRVDEGLDIVSDTASKVTKKLIQLRQQFTTGQQVVPIVGEGLAVSWREYSKQEIQGDFEYMVEYGSTQKRDQDFQKALWAQITPTLIQLVQMSAQIPQVALIGREVSKAYEIPLPIIDQLFPDPNTAAPPIPGAVPPQGQGIPPDIAAILGGVA